MTFGELACGERFKLEDRIYINDSIQRVLATEGWGRGNTWMINPDAGIYPVRSQSLAEFSTIELLDELVRREREKK